MHPGGGGSDLGDRRFSPLLGWLVGAVLLGLVAAVDALTPWQLGFSAFYLLPVVWVAWVLGLRWGITVAMVAGGLWLGVDILGGRPVSSEFYRVWDAFNHTLSYILAATAIGFLRREGAVQQALNQRLQGALAEVRELRGLLPVCAWCHQIRDEGGGWSSLEAFLSLRTRVQPTHTICPDCAARLAQEESDGGG